MTSSRHKAVPWYRRLAAFDVANLFNRALPPGEPRTIYVNQDLPSDAVDHKGKLKLEHVFVSNQVVTSKYTVVTFVPRNLLEQFRRVANVFFAGIAILQFFSVFSTISPGLVILPLIVVLLITALKDGYEDVKRHQSDRRVNHTPALILDGGSFNNANGTHQKSKTFTRGLASVIPRRKKPVEESDAEKREDKQAPQQPDNAVLDAPSGSPTSPSSSASQLEDGDNYSSDNGEAYWKHDIWENVRVGDFVKILNDEPIPADIVICSTSEEDNIAYVETKNLDGETNLKSRHAVDELSHLRDARTCADRTNGFGIDAEAPSVNMYKLSAAVVTASKKYPIDLQTVLLRGTVLRNTKWVIGCVMYTGTDTKIVRNSGGTPSKRSKVERQMNPQVFINLALLAILSIACSTIQAVIEHQGVNKGEYWFLNDHQRGNNPNINGLITFGNALITFQNVIPISLYISIEAVRTCQAAFIYFDHNIWYEKTDAATLARSWNLSDDLGQIEYVFSDKTGTLTQNAMVFRQCSIGGKIYKGDSDEEAGVIEVAHSQQPSAVPSQNGNLQNATDADVPGKKVDSSETVQPVQKVDVSEGVLSHFQDATLAADIEDAAHSTTEHARMLNGFFTCIGLCHSALAAVDPKTHTITYKAQSPDEAALVQAAADVGFIFLGRDRETLRLQTPFSTSTSGAREIQEWELLNVLDFTSARKRMSVVVKKMDDSQRIFLFTKGADNVIFERLAAGKEELKKITEHHLEDFAGEGLRTLCLAYKMVSADEYERWAERYHEATVAIDNREAKIEAVSEELEGDLRLLGATAIEDRLQDGVPEAIAHLKRAGIKVWVATGDKLETAISIGYSTNLIARDSNLIIVRDGAAYGELKSTYEQMRGAVDKFFTNDGILEIESVKPHHEHVLMHPGRRRSSVSSAGTLDIGEGNGERPGGFVLVIDGGSLTKAFDESEPFTKELLLQLSTRCEAVICCRVSPLQKAQMVRLIKDGLHVITLAIGDGANDVSMIQAADVGVGISGEEGLQAVNSSDYAIAQFRFLTRLLFVHGHWSYFRNGNMIVNFFYKNLVIIGVLFWFQIYCDWSTTYVVDYTYLLFWNVFWTIAPVIAIGLFDRLIDDDILVAIPELYHYGREGYWFGSKLFIIYMLDAVYQSVIIFFFLNYTYGTTTARHDGYEVGMYEFSTVMVISCVMVANIFNGFNTHAWTWWVVFAVSIGIILIWAFLGIYSLISPGWFFTYSFGNAYYLFRAPYFWFGIPIVFILSLAPRYICKAVKVMYFPDDIDILRWIRKSQPNRDIARDPMLGGHRSNLYQLRYAAESREDGGPHPSSRRGSQRSVDARGSRADMASGMITSSHRGFDFSTEERGYAMNRMQTNLSERRLQQLRRKDEPSSPKKRGASISKTFSLRRKPKPPT